MFLKIAVVACVLAIANAGFIPAPAQYTFAAPALTSGHDQILRSPGNLAQISSSSKLISTPFSSSSKSDVRVSNPAIYAQATPLSYASYAAPAVAHVAAAPAPLAYSGYHAAPALPVAHSGSLLGVAYSPAVAVSHMSYSSPVGISYSW